MTTEEHIREMEKILTELQSDTLEAAKDGDTLMGLGARYATYNAYAGERMATFKRDLLQKRALYYETFVFNARAQKLEFTSTMIKDYVNAKCYREQYAFDIAERVNRACVHNMDLIRTSMSFLKTEMANLSYQQSRR